MAELTPLGMFDYIEGPWNEAREPIREFQRQVEAAIGGVTLGIPPRTIYASTVAALDSDIVSGGGTDDTAALQAILDTASSIDHLHLIINGVALISGLDIKSNTTISALNGGGFYLKNGGDRAALRNDNRTSGTVVDKNIILEDLTINGNYANQDKFEAGGSIVGGMFVYGTIFNCAVQLFGVENLKTRNLKVIDSKNWSVHLANVNHVHMIDTWLINTEVPNDNHDGIHINGVSSDITIVNTRLTGTTDDGIAINADDGTESSIVALGPINDVTVDNLFLDTCTFGVRVISNGSRVDNISIRNVHGVVEEYVLHIDDLSYYFGSGTGNIGRVILDGVNITTVVATPTDWSEAVRVEAAIEELTVINFNQGAGWYEDYRPIIRVLNGSATTGYGNVRALKADFNVYDPAGTDTLPADARAGPRLVVEGNVENLVYHINHYRDPSVTQGMGAFQIISGDIAKGVTNMEFGGVVNRQANTLVLTSGKFTNLRINGLTDLDNGGVTLLVAAPSGTVQTPRVSSSNVTLNGGTFLGGAGTSAVVSQATGWKVSFDGMTAHGIPVITGATPSVRGLGQVLTGNGGATTITNFTLGYPGQTLIVVMGDANTTIQHNANIITRAGADIVPANGKTYTFISTAADVWRETSGAAAGGGAPTGTAGGVLGGTYPNPSFAVDMATQAELDAAIAGVSSGTADEVFHAEDDGFDTSTLNAKWTQGTLGTAPTALIHNKEARSCYLVKFAGAASGNMRISQTVASGSGDMAYTLKLNSMFRNGANSIINLYLFNSGTTAGVLAQLIGVTANSLFTLNLKTWETDVTAGSLTSVDLKNSSAIYIHIQKVSNVWTLLLSFDGRSWQPVSATLSKTVTIVSMLLDFVQASTGTKERVAVDWVRRDWFVW